ncbi:MAG: DUF1573 domain-containing protein [Phycisphaerae bacterium]|nr:DUF1573 domain-containing protein [Phycisphaerae bacterium]
MKQSQGMTAVLAMVLMTAVATALAQDSPIKYVPRDTTKGPVLRVEPPNWDFGEVWYGAPLSTEVKLTNVGSETLEIKNIRKSCGCTGAKLDKRTLEPAETTIMEVGYDSTKGREKVQQTITIETNDPGRPTTRFTLSGTCKPMFDFEINGQKLNIPSLQLGQLSKSEVKSGTLTIKPLYDKHKVHLALADEKVAGYDVKLKEVVPGEQYELTATTIPPLDPGAAMTVVHLKTDVEFMDTMKVRLGGYVIPAVRVVPDRLMVSPKLTFESKKRVKIVYLKTTPIEVLNIECDDPRVTWEKLEAPGESSGPNGAIELEVTLPPGDSIPEAGIKLTITTDSQDPDYETLEVPILQSVIRRPASSADAPNAGRASGADVRKLIEARAAELKKEKGDGADGGDE